MDHNHHISCYYESSLDLSIPIKLQPDLQGFELIFGKAKYFFSKQFTPFNSATSTLIFQNKLYASFFLSNHNIPIPKTEFIHLDEYIKSDLKELIAELRFPLAVKLLETNFPEGVSSNIQSLDALKEFMDLHLSLCESVLIQEYHEGLNTYRILVFNHQIISIIQYIPAHIRTCSNDYKIINTKINKKNKKLILDTAQLTGLNLLEINLECEDINKPIGTSKGMITEINHNPDIKLHETATQGKAKQVSLKMLRSLIYRHPWAYFSSFSRLIKG